MSRWCTERKAMCQRGECGSSCWMTSEAYQRAGVHAGSVEPEAAAALVDHQLDPREHLMEDTTPSDVNATGIVAHFYLSELSARSYDKAAAEVKFQVVGNAQNKTWAAATPSGQLSMTIKNPAAARQFTIDDLGAEYEVTIRKITKAPATPA